MQNMKVKFIGVPGESHESINMYGQVFQLGKAAEVKATLCDQKMAERKLANHPHFQVVGEKAADAQAADDTAKPSEGLTVAQLHEALEARGIAIPEGVSKKADLAELLDNSLA